MKSRNIFFVIILLICTSAIYAQLGIRAGVNKATEIISFSQANVASTFYSNNLMGYQIGLVYQAMPKKSGFGVEIGAMLSQKGSTIDSTNIAYSIKEGYKEINYLEVPINIRYRLSLGFIGIYGFGGVYGGYALSGKMVNETTEHSSEERYQSFIDRSDYGYNFGAGIELFKKIQFGATWNKGLKNTLNNANTNYTNLPISFKNSVFTINLVYQLW
jgi:hypothetical protein